MQLTLCLSEPGPFSAAPRYCRFHVWWPSAPDAEAGAFARGAALWVERRLPCSLKMQRRVGPTQVAQLALRTAGDGTEARNAGLRTLGYEALLSRTSVAFASCLQGLLWR